MLTLHLSLYPHLCIMVRLRLKLLNAVSRSRGAPRPNSILPACPPARPYWSCYSDCLVSLGKYQFYPCLLFAAILESASDDDVDLSQAKSALRVLAALGDGLTGCAVVERHMRDLVWRLSMHLM